MRTAILLSLLSLAACGRELTAEEHLSEGVIDARALDDVKQFLQLNPDPLKAKTPLKLFVVDGASFSAVLPPSLRDGNAAAFCSRSPRTNTVYINADSATWRDRNPLLKRALVWHELGHCLLWKSHVEEQGSLMFPYVQYLQNELDLIEMLRHI